MGTVVSFTVLPGQLSARAVHSAIRDACHVLHRADRIFSTWDPNSPLSRLRHGRITGDRIPDDVAEVLALCEQARADSRGWFDPWAAPGGVDPTGLVKGWAAERAVTVLQQAGVAAALVNAGGDVATVGAPVPGRRWTVGIRHPWRGGALAAVIEAPAAVATSGTYERGPHLFHPATGQPAAPVVSATVTGPSLAFADAFATAMAVGGDEVLDAVSALDGYDGYLIRPDGTEAWSDGVRFVPQPQGSSPAPS